jgi:acyl dehydratase
VYEHRPGRTLTDQDNISFALLTMNQHPMHCDMEFAKKSEFGRLLINSSLSLAVVVGMTVNDVSAKAIANLGWKDIKLSGPVFAGDTLYAETKVLDKRQSKSRPHQGIVTVHTHLVLVSRLAGVRSPVDGVTLAFADDQALASDVARARRMGMGAKLCIHPKQVAGVYQGFAPSASELEWAQRVLLSVEQHGLGAIAVDGKLVDRPVWLLAQSLVADAQASGHA